MSSITIKPLSQAPAEQPEWAQKYVILRRNPRGEIVPKYEMKSWKQFFQPIVNGTKKHDLRSTKDRSFEVGDVLTLREYDMEKGEYTGYAQNVRITFITSNDTPCAYSSAALDRGYAILSLELVGQMFCYDLTTLQEQ